MLVLSRKAGERIQVGENISIEIRRVAGNRVTLAIEAPRDVRILRGELEIAAPEDDNAERKVDEPYVVSHSRMTMPRYKFAPSKQAVG